MLASVALLVLSVDQLHSIRVPWWWADLAKLKSEGVLVGYPDGIPRPKHNRWVAAVSVNAAYTNAQQITASWPQAAREVAQGKPNADIREELRHSQSIRLLPRLVEEFAYELTELGVDVPLVRREVRLFDNQIRWAWVPRPGEANDRFPDVKPGHWADEAIHRLRYEGILRGYPGERFVAPGKR